MFQKSACELVVEIQKFIKTILFIHSFSKDILSTTTRQALF